MSGREKFKKYRFFIKVLTIVFGSLGKRVNIRLYNRIMFKRGTLIVLFRYCIISNLVSEIGDNVYISSNVVIKGFENIKLGSNVSIHENCYIDGIGSLEIHDDVSIAHSTSIITQNHGTKLVEIPFKYQSMLDGKVIVQRNVWIGCGVRIMPNTVINSDVVIAAGSVVTKECLSKKIYAGIPAKELKNLEE